MKKIKLSDIAKACSGTFNTDAEVNAVCIDTRKITPGCLFICIKGERFDAHDFAQEALDKGAAAVMIHKDVNVSGSFVKVKNTSDALLTLGGWYRSMFNIPLVGLTGSVGKTTTKEFIYLVMSAKYNTVKTQGNLNNEIGLPQMLLSFDDKTEAAVIEMGMNHFGEIHQLVTETKPTVGLITNIGTSHIENLGSREGILKAKLEILDGLEENSPFIINSDNDMLATILDNKDIMTKYNVITFGIESDAQYKAVNITEKNGSTDFDVEYPIANVIAEKDGLTATFSYASQHISIPTIGIHNVYNALAAFAVGACLDIKPRQSADALAKYVPEGMRQKTVNFGGVTFIEDCYNASLDSMKAAIATLTGTNANKKIAVFSDMLELGDFSKQAHEAVGELAAKAGIDVLLTVGKESRFIYDAAEKNGIKSARHFESKEALADKLLEILQKGDAVIFKASRGMKLEDVIHIVYDRWGK